MSLFDDLLQIQSELKAPKDQYSAFGEYHYRSCEQIFEAVKPLLKKYSVLLTVSDELVPAGNEIYIKAVATVKKGDETLSNTAFAREAHDKKKLDASQMTGVASSYARKYALNGLFLIDDTKDADTDEFKRNVSQRQSANATQPAKQNKSRKAGTTQPAINAMTSEQKSIIKSFDDHTLHKAAEILGFTTIKGLTKDQANNFIDTAHAVENEVNSDFERFE